jgi:hypothetical protein
MTQEPFRLSFCGSLDAAATLVPHESGGRRPEMVLTLGQRGETIHAVVLRNGPLRRGAFAAGYRIG